MVLLIFVVFAIRSSWFQTFAAQEVAEWLSDELGTDVSIDKVDIVFFDRATLEGIYVEDTRGDTLLYTKSIDVLIDALSFSESFVNISRAELNTGRIYLRKYEGDSTLNFQHLVDFFKSEEEDTSSSPFDVNVDAIWLEDIEFSYDDDNVEPKEHGMDFAHIRLRHCWSHFSEFGLDGDSIAVKIDDLRFQDQSGLTLSKFTTNFLYCPQAIAMNKMKIGIENSWIYSDHFELKTPNGSEDWSDFVHKVRFDANISNSKLSLKDLAYFVPAIWGMTDRVRIVNIDISGPVYGMKLRDVDIRLLDTTVIKGSFDIPPLDDPSSLFFLERIKLFRTSIADVEKLNLSPFIEKEKLQKWLDQYRKADLIRLVEGDFVGTTEDFVVNGDLYSSIGNFHSDDGLHFVKKGEVYYYDGPDREVDTREIIVENLDLGVISGNPRLGPVTGYVKIRDGSKGLNQEDLSINFDGHFDNAWLNEYTYHDINIKGGNFTNNVFSALSPGSLTIEDDNLALEYNGYVDLKGDMKFVFDVRLDSANIDRIANQRDSIGHKLQAEFAVRIEGNSLDKLKGTLRASNISYHDGRRDFEMKELYVDFIRHPSRDTILLKSDYVDADLSGQFALAEIHHVLLHQMAYVIDNMIGHDEVNSSNNNFFDLNVTMKDINPILELVDADLYVAINSTIKSKFDKKGNRYSFDFRSDSLVRGTAKLLQVRLDNHFDSTKANLYYSAKYGQLNDSTKVRNVYIDSYVKRNVFLNTIGWDGLGRTEPALIAFHSEVHNNSHVTSYFDPSFFFLQKHKWEIKPGSIVDWTPQKITVEGFKILHGDNFIGVDGVVSQDPSDKLNLQVYNFDLSDLSGVLVGTGIELDGLLNVKGSVADVYKNLRLESESDISALVINDNHVGDIHIRNAWNQESKTIDMSGSLKREGITTFSFDGGYYLDKKKDNVSLNLNFDNTDIAFLNAFENKELYTNIAGNLNGRLKVSGEIDNPVVKGTMDLTNTKVFVPMFNVGYGLSGKIDLDKGQIVGDFLNLYDQEGNKAQANLQVFHEDWKNWSYDITLDLDENRIDRFYVLNTVLKEGEFYYGDAYVTGQVNISGYGGKTRIDVAVKTEPGTNLILPMYGTDELSEDSFIEYVNHDSITNEVIVKKTIERSGLELDLKFEVTTDAAVTVVFDPIYEDQIVCIGAGDLEVTIDELGEVKMFGTYTIQDGDYFMRMKNIVNKDFAIRKGSTVTWTQSPYDANINIIADFYRSVSVADILPVGMGNPSEVEVVIGSLIMSNTLMNPKLDFDIRAPKAEELATAAINEIRANPDQLKKQFFALLVLEKFLPTQGFGSGAGTNAALGLAENQINAVLGNISENYALAADLSDKGAKININKQLGEKISIKTSLGVVTPGGTQQSGGSIVGDVMVEYKLNEDGSFNMTFFNESNTGSEAVNGPFTQGIGLHYEETFEKGKDFNLLQNFLNIFRKKSNDIHVRPKKKDDNYRPIPEE